MAKVKVDFKTLLDPAQEDARVDQLRALALSVPKTGRPDIPDAIVQFLRDLLTDDAREIAAIGIVLHALERAGGGEPSLATLARLFTGLHLPEDPELEKACREAFGNRSPRQVHDQLVNAISSRGCPTVDAFYANELLGRVPREAATDSLKAYLEHAPR